MFREERETHTNAKTTALWHWSDTELGKSFALEPPSRDLEVGNAPHKNHAIICFWGLQTQPIESER